MNTFGFILVGFASGAVAGVALAMLMQFRSLSHTLQKRCTRVNTERALRLLSDYRRSWEDKSLTGKIINIGFLIGIKVAERKYLREDDNEDSLDVVGL